MSQATSKRVAVVVGVGPGLGAATALRFAREGFAVALMARGQDKLDPVRRQIEQAGGRAAAITADATEPASVSAAFDRVREELGHASVLIYNAGAFVFKSLVDTSPDEFVDCWKANCYGAFLTTRQVLPAMAEARHGTVIFTGATAALRGGARFANLAVGKFGLRALAQSTAREFAPQGIHVAHAIIDGQIDLETTRAANPDRAAQEFLSPDAIADAYWQLHQQHPSAWTLELDLRPHVERF
jgi:NAD(P)-dependent dehydrogenase (short-subunit alcohol dehydrogenase family)